MSVRLTIDGRAVEVEPGTTVFDAARAAGIEVPVLCHDPGLRPVGVCRICTVEVEGARTLVASCAQEGLVRKLPAEAGRLPGISARRRE